MTKSPPLAYRVKDAAQALSVSRSTIYKLVAEQKLRIHKVAGRSLISHADLAALLAA